MHIKSFTLFFAAMLMVTGCTDVWEDHTAVSANVSQQSITEYMKSQSTDYSTFIAMLESTGVDKKLDSSMIYTLWAPTNAAVAAVDQSLIDTDEEKKLFVLNHVALGRYSAQNSTTADSLYMLSGKKLYYQPDGKIIDGVAIETSKEVTVKNGVVQFVNSAVTPKMSIWEWMVDAAPENKFIKYLKSLTAKQTSYSGYLGKDDKGNAFYQDSVVTEVNYFLKTIVDVSSEDSLVTILIPSDEVFDAHFAQFEKFYRRDDRESNVIPTKLDSAYILLNIAKDFVFKGSYSLSEVPDTLVSFFSVKVPFVRNAVGSSYQASNGFAYMVSDCSVKTSDKILPIVIDVNKNTVYPSVTSYPSTGHLGLFFYRERANAFNGYDAVLDQNASSGILQGLEIGFKGYVNSVKYRVKFRAINDFSKSFTSPDTTTLKQKVCAVTVLRNADGSFKGLSETNNVLTSDAQSDVKYTVGTDATYYAPIAKKVYSSDNYINDEIDLGYYNYRYMEYPFFRIIPQAIKMAVAVDYIRLVPVLE